MTQIYRFCFLSFCSSLIYLLSMIGNLTIITLTFIDSHLKIPMYFFLRNFFILEVFYRCLYSQIPVYLASGDNTVTYNLYCHSIIFSYCPGCDWVFLPDGHVLWPLCGHLQAPALHDHQEQHGLHQFLIGCCMIAPNHHHPPSGMGFQLEFVTLSLWLWCCSHPEDCFSDTEFLEWFFLVLTVLRLISPWCM